MLLTKVDLSAKKITFQEGITKVSLKHGFVFEFGHTERRHSVRV